MLRALTRAQLMEWMAYATLEPVGNPQKIEDPEKVRKARRERVEGGFMKLAKQHNG